MTLNIFTGGINTSFSSQLNQNLNESLILVGLEHIRTLIDRTTTYSKWNIDGWGEAYIDDTGRSNSVSTTTSASFSTNKYQYSSDPWYTNTGSDSFTGTTNDASVSSMTTTLTCNSPCILTSIGFKATNSTTMTSGQVVIKRNGTTICTATIPDANYSGGGTVTLTKGNYTDYFHTSDSITLEWSCGGTQFQRDDNTSITGTYVSATNQFLSVGTLVFTNVDTTSESLIIHTIPTGTFSNTISKAIGVPMFASTYETGDNVQFKLTNASEDSGWLNYNTLTSFTAFTSQPTTLTVSLISTSTGTSTYPEIYGFWVRAA
jgi:hypothetical protein